MTADFDPQLKPTPFGQNPEYDLAQMEQFKASLMGYIDAELAVAETYEDFGWDGEPGVFVTDGEYHRAKDGAALTASAANYHGDPHESERKISLFEPKRQGYTISFLDDGGITVYPSEVAGIEHPDDEWHVESLKEAAQDIDFYTAFETIHQAIHSDRFKQKKEAYPVHELDHDVSVVALSEDQRERIEDKIASDALLQGLAALPHPTHHMKSGDFEWYAASPIQNDGRNLIHLYVPGEHLQVFTVYTSNSQASWRLLPGVGNDKNPYWFQKPLAEEMITLPYQMQSALWKFTEEVGTNTLTDDEFHDVLDDVRTLTDSRPDVFLAGGASKTIQLRNGEYEPVDEDKLPQESANDEPVHYSFASSMYGQVDARLIPSRDGELTYVTYTRTSDGVRWVGMIQANDAKMFDSFILDKLVIAPGYYASPQEYVYDDNHESKGYGDNVTRVLGSVAARALNGDYSGS